MRCHPPSRRDRSRRRSRRRAAAAMVEAVIALPVLLALLFGVSFTRSRHAARQAALLDARRCAFLHAANGCPDAHPPGCDDVIFATASETDPRATAILDATRSAQAGTTFDVLERVPALRDALEFLFGTTTRARGSRALALPGRPAEPLVETASMVVLCNERPTNVLSAAKRALCSSAPLPEIVAAGLCEGSP